MCQFIPAMFINLKSINVPRPAYKRKQIGLLVRPKKLHPGTAGNDKALFRL